MGKLSLALSGLLVVSFLACSGAAPYDFPKDAPSAPSSTSSGPDASPSGAPGATVPGDDAGADATVPQRSSDGGVGSDAAPSDAALAKDAAKDSAPPAPTKCKSEADCPNLEACFLDDTPRVCGTGHACGGPGNGVCNGGCCSSDGVNATAPKCMTGNDDTACGVDGDVCEDCTQSGLFCFAGACQ